VKKERFLNIGFGLFETAMSKVTFLIRFTGKWHEELKFVPLIIHCIYKKYNPSQKQNRSCDNNNWAKWVVDEDPSQPHAHTTDKDSKSR